MSMRLSSSVWKRRGTFVIDIRRYRADFQVLVDQLRRRGQEGDCAIVRVRPYQDFKRWATGMRTEYDDRHFYPGVEELVRRGSLPEQILRDDYEATRVIGPHLRRLGMEWLDVVRLGMDRHIEDLAQAIRSGKEVPPLVSVGGVPRDGRHRALAAMKLGLGRAPILDVEDMFPCPASLREERAVGR